jgi:2-polyprenyl-3-methyl-5-hydroxy-6-metoxy-1,4-benzoquinol methylase
VNTDKDLSSDIYGSESESGFNLARRNTTVSLLSEFVGMSDSLKILDVGCGRGIITRSIHSSFQNALIDAIDNSENELINAKNRSMGINYILADALTFSGSGYLYDAILLNNIYEHVENPVGMLRNLKKLLQDEGVFIISTPNRYHIRNIVKKILGRRICIPYFHVTEYSIGQIRDHHIYAGLTIKKIITPKFRRERFRLSNLILFQIIGPVLDFYMRMIRSQTRFSPLLFVVSRKEN